MSYGTVYDHDKSLCKIQHSIFDDGDEKSSIVNSIQSPRQLRKRLLNIVKNVSKFQVRFRSIFNGVITNEISD